MYQEERLMAILQHLQTHRRISVQEICDRFGVSRDTARRDIVRLEEQGEILRTRGGAILPTLSKSNPKLAERLQRESGSKQRIGALAATLIKDRDYLILDASTTVQVAAMHLRSADNVVVTNSLDIASLLSEKEQITVHLLGGRLDLENRYVYGARAIAMLADYHADKLLIGTHGLTHEGLYIPTEEEGFLVREMIRRADQVILLADHSKFGVKHFARIAGLEQIDILVTDRMPPEDLLQALQRHEVELLVTEG